MKNQFVKVKLSPSGEVWINVANIVSIRDNGSSFTIYTNSVSGSDVRSYSVKGSVEDFFKTLGLKAESFIS